MGLFLRRNYHLCIKWHFKPNRKNPRGKELGSSCVFTNTQPGFPWNQGQHWWFQVPLIKTSNVPPGHQIHYSCPDPAENQTHSCMGILMRASISIVWLYRLGLLPLPKMYLTFFSHLNHGSSFLEHAEHNSPCSTLQSALSAYAKCYYCSSFRSDLRRDNICSKELQAVHCGIFIVTNLKYISVRKYI